MVEGILVGGGPVGLSLGIALARLGVPTVLIEQHERPEEKPLCEVPSQRVYALHDTVRVFLEAIGVWSAIDERHVAPMHRMQLWERNGDLATDLQAGALGFDALAWAVSHEALMQALWRVADTLPALDTQITPDEKQLQYQGNGWCVASGTKRWYAKWVVGADGAKSWVRESLDFVTEITSSEHAGIVATLSTEVPHQNTAYQQFGSENVLALLPLANPHQVSLVYSVTDAQQSMLAAQDGKGFAEHLTRATHRQFGTLSLLSERRYFPYRHQHVTPYAKAGVYLLGDAAHVIHPLAGQGMNLGLMDATAFLHTWHKAKAQSLDLTDEAMAKHYQRLRRGQNALMGQLMRHFEQHTVRPIAAAAPLMRWGQRLFQRCRPLQRGVVHFANGHYLPVTRTDIKGWFS